MWEKLKLCEGFEWDEGNSEKNWLKHKVRKTEIEQVFFNQPLIMAEDEKHSNNENRFLILGRTNHNRALTVIFTIRRSIYIRVISARDMSKNERKAYEKEIKKDS